MGNGIDSSIQEVGSFDPSTLSGRLEWLMSGLKWTYEDFGTPVSLTYSFSDAGSSYKDAYGFGENIGVFGFNDQQKAAAVMALANYAAVCNLSFTEVTESSSLAGDIRWANTTSDAMPTAGSFYPYPLAEGGDIWMGDDYGDFYQNPDVGSYGYVTFLHELGHALGLKHPHDDVPVAPASHDTLKYTVMSYKDYVGDTPDGYDSEYFPTTLMMDDIYVMQFLYGINYNTNAGDTVYSWGSTDHVFETIWDGGGNDTIDASNMAQGVKITLEDGKFSSIGESFWNGQAEVRDCLGIAYFCDIENATGSAGNDSLSGNELENQLIGNGGKDRLNGGIGDDILTGGSGNDSFRFDSKLSLSNVDIITDFTVGKDKIELNNSKFGMLVDGALNAGNFVANSTGTAHDGDDYIIYKTSNGKVYYDYDGNGAGKAIEFAVIGYATHAALTAADFHVL